MLLRVLFPQPYIVEVSKLRQQLDEAHFAWATAWKRRQLDYTIENIRFTHDPDWNKRLFSLQAAHDGKTWFWGTMHVVAGWGVMSI
ncbi:MAG: hypothetical protein KGK01_09160 [Bradyrhizobium sp.]|uniref:hypothetical protein n=1 Tax=Bradyrhizobium sp. TaxID=376 RepID=UPI001C286537|nr:hypothetical protein [Bradyrhizobium sp.]MBU6462060.1 hypothetical protein [Pseudomonadota bacterium]MDE2066443.1 hypothetical protein [Bradyrhizobium sp.]MDE2242594.1 hypothetical protein [Bradyrhizobium sp.]MDE2469376.1 hypothetical protein [Bradyrhizobium sp.]